MIVISTFLTSCVPATIRIENYSEYVNNLFVYEVDEIDVDDGVGSPEDGVLDEFIPQIAPEIDGLTRISEYQYDAGIEFFGAHTIVKLGNKTYLMDLNGVLAEKSQNESTSPDIVFEDYLLKYDKIVAKNDGKYGVLELNGTIIVDFEYDDILVRNNIIIAIKGDSSKIFYDNTYICDGTKSAYIVGDCFYGDMGKIYELPVNKRAMVGEYFVVNISSNNIAVIIDDAGRFGYADYITKEVLIEPQYFMANPMNSDFAVVYDLIADDIDYPKLVSLNNELIYDFKNLLNGVDFSPYDINVFECNYGYNLFTIMSSNITGVVKVENGLATAKILPVDIVPWYNFVYNDYIVSEVPIDFYSLSKEEFVGTNYIDILPINNTHFIVKCLDGKYALLDKNLNTVVENCDKISNYNDTILIENDGKFCYYRLP